jgi:ferritin-like protein
MLRLESRLFALLEDNQLSGVRNALQAAIELEHATMPPYLYAYYSLGTANPAVREPLRAIVRGEMLHMLLACNILTAIGGHPQIDASGFVPTYPTALPGALADGLIVPLKAFSRELAQAVFMEIEEPETPLHFAALAAPTRTIGQFYAKINEQLRTLGDGIFTGDPAHQVTVLDFGLDDADMKITKVDSASNAIDRIVRQGEGTTDSPTFDGAQLAHYYRFEELVRGRKLIPNPAAGADAPPQERYVFRGPVIAFEPQNVLPLRENPRAAQLPAGSPERQACDDCNRAYTRMLGFLHRAFNGRPALIADAIGVMIGDLSTTARQLTSLALKDGTRVGPSFEYLA